MLHVFNTTARKSTDCHSFIFIIFFEIVCIIPDHSPSHMNINTKLIFPSMDFDWYQIDSTDQYGEKWQLHEAESPSPSARVSLH